MQRHLTKLTHQLVEVKDHEKSDHKSTDNFKNPYLRHEQTKQLLDHDEYDV